MCRVIDSEIVIGNFLIESANKEILDIDIDKLLEFNSILSAKLSEIDFYSGLSNYLVNDFIESYPFFVDAVDETHLNIKSEKPQAQIIDSLTRYFRYGVINDIVDKMHDSFDELMG